MAMAPELKSSLWFCRSNGLLPQVHMELFRYWLSNTSDVQMSKKVKMGKPWPKNVGTVQCVWNGEAEEAFEMLNDAICKASRQVLPGEGCKYVLHSDASKYVVGAVISQKQQDGEPRVIAFWSMKIKSPETRYPTYERALLAIHDVVVNWHYHLYSKINFAIHTDHASVRYILSRPPPTHREMEYLAISPNYTYGIWYIPGAKNQVADPLRRCPDITWKHFQVSECQLTQFVVQDSTEWLPDVAAKTKDNSWSEDVVQILLCKESEEHAPKASAPSTLQKAWGHSHCFSLDDGVLHLDIWNWILKYWETYHVDAAFPHPYESELSEKHMTLCWEAILQQQKQI